MWRAKYDFKASTARTDHSAVIRIPAGTELHNVDARLGQPAYFTVNGTRPVATRAQFADIGQCVEEPMPPKGE